MKKRETSDLRYMRQTLYFLNRPIFRTFAMLAFLSITGSITGQKGSCH
ncbi:MAG TPA: hypothetical protein VF399_04045 [bacterium]